MKHYLDAVSEHDLMGDAADEGEVDQIISELDLERDEDMEDDDAADC